MKKSEMVDIMTNSWRKYIYNLKSPDDAGVRNGMRSVLAEMEKAGMRPPCSMKDEGHGDPESCEFSWENE